MASGPGGLTYLEVGATSGVLPAGYHHVHESATVGSGREDFEVAARTVLEWGMHRGAGLTVRTAAPTAVAGQDATFGLGPVAIPVRIVYVVDDANRKGFAYGTRAGHPECGEELFVVQFDETSQAVRIEIVAFSKPGTWWVRLGAPIGRRVQAFVTRRYIRAVRASVDRSRV
ncbi:DUF1990 domain-containing protein [Rhodococcus erythropolis]|uniref:DUF1990 domain-containing protein n=1 Tax=Rhodococcus TaxID=1827 RepID=UPI00064BF41F|nr:MULTISPECIES: DUF1990 domain-containing protein [Rhodococcus]MBT1255751.1 DUF1990 domain-containing protein [Rhodococcus erythropolis]OHF25859.1 hypothetical protein BKP30_22000 [Rhodococcus erythropolis]